MFPGTTVRLEEGRTCGARSHSFMEPNLGRQCLIGMNAVIMDDVASGGRMHRRRTVLSQSRQYNGKTPHHRRKPCQEIGACF